MINILRFLLVVALQTTAKGYTADNQSVLKGQWIHSDHLRPGMKVMTSDNRFLTVKESWAKSPETTTTYNFEVADAHTYFVSENNLWVHNTCWENVQLPYVRYSHTGDITTTVTQPVKKRVTYRGDVKWVEYDINLVRESDAHTIFQKLYNNHTASSAADGASDTVVKITMRSKSRGPLMLVDDEVKYTSRGDVFARQGLGPVDDALNAERVWENVKTTFIQSSTPLGNHKLNIMIQFIGDNL